MDIPRDWSFERHDVAASFDRHVREQLPFYDMATGLVAHLVRHYLPDGGRVVDLGASTGNIGTAIGDTIRNRRAGLLEIERSPQMAEAWLKQHPGRARDYHIDHPPTAEQLARDEWDRRRVLAQVDAIEWVETTAAETTNPTIDVVIAFLLMQFLPVDSRGPWLGKLCGLLRPGGAVILVDKFDAPAGYAGTVIRRLTLAGKVAADVAPSEIVAKELSLAGVQRPLAWAALARHLPGDIEAVEVFRWGEFRGYLLERHAP